MYNHNKAQQSKNRVHISWAILYLYHHHYTSNFKVIYRNILVTKLSIKTQLSLRSLPMICPQTFSSKPNFILSTANTSLIHWGRVTHICIIVSDNGLSPGKHQAIIWTNAEKLLIWYLQIISVKSYSNFIHFKKNCIWRCRVENGGHFDSASILTRLQFWLGFYFRHTCIRYIEYHLWVTSIPYIGVIIIIMYCHNCITFIITPYYVTITDNGSPRMNEPAVGNITVV